MTRLAVSYLVGSKMYDTSYKLVNS